ncbi:hypothetical protein DB346_08615 [Verrucomicrobia bacterium LW23]|nr:hypothetical protein DB346_08615 [Verrucomicrobia bacterium LW23]
MNVNPEFAKGGDDEARVSVPVPRAHDCQVISARTALSVLITGHAKLAMVESVGAGAGEKEAPPAEMQGFLFIYSINTVCAAKNEAERMRRLVDKVNALLEEEYK